MIVQIGIEIVENIVYRHEEKYIISKKESVYLKSFLNIVCQQDKYSIAGDGKYWIRSLYFDTIFNEDYNEKLLGVCNRKKIRLRIYDFDASVVKLEIKNKLDDYSIKETVVLSVDDAMDLLRGNIEILLRYKSKVACKAYYFMKKDLYTPRRIVDYEREAYIYPVDNIRITIDYNIKTCDELALFDTNLLLYPVLNDEICILEVKYDNALPQILNHILATAQLTKSAYSKYCASRNCYDTLFTNEII